MYFKGKKCICNSVNNFFKGKKKSCPMFEVQAECFGIKKCVIGVGLLSLNVVEKNISYGSELLRFEYLFFHLFYSNGNVM